MSKLGRAFLALLVPRPLSGEAATALHGCQAGSLSVAAQHTHQILPSGRTLLSPLRRPAPSRSCALLAEAVTALHALRGADSVAMLGFELGLAWRAVNDWTAHVFGRASGPAHRLPSQPKKAFSPHPPAPPQVCHFRLPAHGTQSRGARAGHAGANQGSG